MPGKVLPALLALFLLVSPVAFAAEPQPGAACSPNESFTRTGGQENPGSGHFMVCAGGVWVNFIDYLSASGYVGVKKAVPAAPLHVGGEAIIGPTTGLACSSTTKGGLRWSDSSSTFEMCDGTSWRTIAASVAAGCTGPSAFSFTNVTNAPLSTLITSNTITPSGCNATMSASVTGSGNPQISVNGGAWTTNTSIDPGQTLQVRLTSSASVDTVLSAVVTIGSTTGTTWTVTTKTGNTRIFQTSSTYNGNSGGFAGADTTCNSAAATLGYGGYWKAVLSDSIENAQARLTITYPVVKASNTATTIAATNLWGGSLSNAIGSGTSNIWTGTTSGGLSDGSGSCTSWTSSSSSVSAMVGSGGNTDSQWVAWSGQNCNVSKALYCIEQPDPGCSASAFSFTDVTSASISTLYTSNSITPTGCATSSTVSVYGSGSPQISINSGAWASSGTLNAGDTLQVRRTTGSTYGVVNKVRIYVGNTASTWTLTTLAGGKRVFRTATTYTGNLGGLSGADATCQTEAGTAGYSGTWKAIMSDSTTNAKDRLTLTYPIVRATDGTVVSATNLWNGGLSAVIVSGSGSQVWTGSNSDGTKNASTCSDWSTASSGTSARIGVDTGITATWISSGTNTCNTSGYLYCIEQ